MKRVLLALLGFASAPVLSEEVSSTAEAWRYLTRPGQSKQWLIVSSKRSDNYYVQCENVRTYILCPFPIWAKIAPGEKYLKPSGSRASPFPDVPNTQLRQYLTPQQVAALKKTLTGLGLKPVDVYQQMINQNDKLVGTAYDVRVVLEMDYRGFDSLVSSAMSTLWQASPKEGYNYQTGKWD